MSFYDEIKQYRWEDVRAAIGLCRAEDVERALSAPNPGLGELISLFSPAAEPYLEEMAQRAHRVTQQRFGKVIGLFAPIYLSNECTNSCVYCGFNVRNDARRLTLTVEQAVAEAEYLHGRGFRHILLVSGEAPRIASLEYLSRVVERFREWFSSISIEIYPMDTAQYRTLIADGVDGLVIYQETYDEKRYAEIHPAGRKRDYRWRLETPDRGGEAGFRRIGIGALLGISDWRTEAFFLALHAHYLLRKYWKSHITISFPRIQPAAGGYQPPHPVTDPHLVQMMTALRIFLPDAGQVLSTRESPSLRNHLVRLGITSMSAGSRTDPGGYTHDSEAEEQFAVADERSPEAVAAMIRQMGYEPVWKDWDTAFLH